MNQYEPDYSVPIGEFILEHMEARNMSIAEAAKALGWNEGFLVLVLRDMVELTGLHVLTIASVFTDYPAHVWVKLHLMHQQLKNKMSANCDSCLTSAPTHGNVGGMENEDMETLSLQEFMEEQVKITSDLIKRVRRLEEQVLQSPQKWRYLDLRCSGSTIPTGVGAE